MCNNKKCKDKKNCSCDKIQLTKGAKGDSGAIGLTGAQGPQGPAAPNSWKLNGNNEGVEQYFGTNDNFDIPIYTNGVKNGVFDKNGNFGFGISTSLTARLHVKGISSTSSDYALKVDNSSNSSLLYVRNDGSVGIGGTSIYSNYKLQLIISSANDGLQIIGGGVGTATLTTDTDGTSGSLKLYNSALGFNAVVFNNNSNSYIITPYNFGFGISSPTAKLHVKGISSTSSDYALKVDNSSNSSLFNVRNDGVILANNLPTSSTGLPSGAIWRNGTVLNIV